MRAEQLTSQDSGVCKLIRTYLFLAVPLLGLVGARSMEEGYKGGMWLARVELIDLLAWGALVALVAITLYRAYDEFYLPRRRLRALEAAKERFDSLEDEPETSSEGATAAPQKNSD